MNFKKLLERINNLVESDLKGSNPAYRYGIQRPLSQQEKDDYNIYLMANIAKSLSSIAECLEDGRKEGRIIKTEKSHNRTRD